MQILRDTYLFILFLGLATTGITAQKVIKTKSGQKIVISNSGEWKKFNPENDMELLDEASLLVSNEDIDPFETPLETSYALDRSEEASINMLLDKARYQEAEAAVLEDVLSTRIKNIEIFFNDDLEEEQKAILHLELEEMKEMKDEASLKYETAAKVISKIKKLQSLKPSARSREMTEIRSTLNQSFDITVKPLPAETENDSKYFFKKDDKSRYKQDCNVAFNGIDKSNNNPKIEMAPAHFFSYTHSNLKHYFKADNFLMCNGFLSQEDNKKYLNLEIIIKSKDAKKTYGVLDKNSMFRITFIDGEKFVLNKNIEIVSGTIQEYTGHTVYLAKFELKKDVYKKISKTEIDFVGLIWSTGFEKYDVFEVDILKHQAACLNKIN